MNAITFLSGFGGQLTVSLSIDDQCRTTQQTSQVYTKKNNQSIVVTTRLFSGMVNTQLTLFGQRPQASHTMEGVRRRSVHEIPLLVLCCCNIASWHTQHLLPVQCKSLGSVRMQLSALQTRLSSHSTSVGRVQPFCSCSKATWRVQKYHPRRAHWHLCRAEKVGTE